VRPNSGRIEPGQSVEIQVILQSMREDPPSGAKCKDKFLVQSMAITPDMGYMDLGAMWALSEQNPTQHPAHQQRVKVNFLPAEGDRVDEGEENPADSTFTTVNDSRYDTVRQFPVMNGNGATHLHPNSQPLQALPDEAQDRGASPAPDFHVAHEDAGPNAGIEEVMTRAPPPQSQTQPFAVPPTPPTARPSRQFNDEFETLRVKYAEAQEEIAQLRAVLASAPTAPSTGGLRQRNVASSVGDEATEVGGAETDKEMLAMKIQQQDEYFSPQVVAIIALLVFTLTYLFF